MYYVGGIPFAYDDIRHYGVLGMKWGIRRDKPYKSHATRKYERKLEKYRHVVGSKTAGMKVDVYKRRALRSAELDRRERDYAKSVTAGGNLLSRFLTLGSVGGKAYQAAMAVYGGNGKISRKVGAFATSFLGGRLGEMAVRAIAVRGGEYSIYRDGKKTLSGKVGDYLNKASKNPLPELS